MRKIACCSGGKDSVAMTDKLIELGDVDEVVFYDTGLEFKCIYKIMEKIKQTAESKGIKFTVLRPKCDMCYLMFEKPVKKRNGTIQNGYSWCGGRCRWGTTEKLKAMEKYCKGHIEYVGIAVDEPKRLEKERNGNKVFPLVDWNMTEKDCLEYCYSKGYSWVEYQGEYALKYGVELYSILDRVSCWCCGNKNILELYNMFCYLPEYWARLRGFQQKTDRLFKKNYSIEDLHKKFYDHLNGDKEWKYLRKAKKPIILTHQEDKGE